MRDYAPEVWPEEGVYRGLVAMERADSVTIDPHKLGFVPYPAGAVSFRDRRSRDLVAVEAPYIFHRGASEAGYIGRFIMEGSKPGAAAAAVWMCAQGAAAGRARLRPDDRRDGEGRAGAAPPPVRAGTGARSAWCRCRSRT